MLEAVEICDFSGKLKNMPPPDCTAKVVMIGDSGVGKSKILSSYNGERFNPTYMQTRGDFRKNQRAHNHVCVVMLEELHVTMAISCFFLTERQIRTSRVQVGRRSVELQIW